MQYTLRQIPRALDAALRRRARREGRSLNLVAIEAMARGMGLDGTGAKQRSLGHFAGKWREDPGIDRALAEQDQVDEELWR